jgi:hypothetical protein
MASVTVRVLSTAITGAEITAKTSVASSETATITPSSGQGTLDFNTLAVRVENTSTTAGVTLSIGVGTEFSGLGIGAASVSIATAKTVIIGGKLFEGARFLTSSGTVVFTQTGTGPTSWEAYQRPKAIDS